VLPAEAPWCGRHVYHLVVVRLLERDRDTVAKKLADAGVQTVVHYPVPIHLQKAYAELGYQPGAFPHAELAARTILSLPMFPEMTRAQCDYVSEQLVIALR
jgi:dTDP-4-amino-4,6-dideoxygalactose transaminase